MKVLVGSPVYRQGAYVLDKFLRNQKQIQDIRPDCDLVLSTQDLDYTGELRQELLKLGLRGTVISHTPQKPAYARHKAWNIASARESIRQYFLSQPEAGHLLFLDADMTFDPAVVNILEKELVNQEAVFSGLILRTHRPGLTAGGCLMMRRAAVEKVKFRCYEFSNGQYITEDNVLEMDLYRQKCRIKKGFFAANVHYITPTDIQETQPHQVGLYSQVMTSAFLRYWLLRASVFLHFNIPTGGRKFVRGIFGK